MIKKPVIKIRLVGQQLKTHTNHKHNEHNSSESGGILRASIFGANDGLVSTLALVAGVVAAGMTTKVIILAGLAELFAGAISMAVGEYISTKSEIEFYKEQIRKEKKEMDEMPEVEKREIRDIFSKKGFAGKNLNTAVKIVTSNKRVWLDTMLKDELGLYEGKFDNPVKTGSAIGFAFILLGFIPLLPFFFLAPVNGLILSAILTLLVLFIVGSLKTKVTIRIWWRSGLEQMLIGLLASAVAYAIGYGFGLMY